jgi:hypothetical protein
VEILKPSGGYDPNRLISKQDRVACGWIGGPKLACGVSSTETLEEPAFYHWKVYRRNLPNNHVTGLDTPDDESPVLSWQLPFGQGGSGQR